MDKEKILNELDALLEEWYFLIKEMPFIKNIIRFIVEKFLNRKYKEILP